MTSDNTTGGNASSDRIRLWRKPIIGFALLALILFTGPVVGWMSAGGKISPQIDRSAAEVNIVIDLAQPAKLFHRETLSAHGIYAGRDRTEPADRSRLVLRNVAQDSLRTLSRYFWIESIEPMR